MTALHIAADLYLRRFRLDTADNLLARKHVTQVRVLLRAADVLVIMVTLGGRADDLRAGAAIRRQPVRLRRRRRHRRRPRRAAGAEQLVRRRADSR